MGIFDSILGRDWKWYFEKAKHDFELCDYGQTMDRLDRAVELAQKEKANTQDLLDFQEKVRRTIFEQAMERAKALLRSQNEGAAQNCIDLALRHAKDEAEKAELNDMISQSHHYLEPAQGDEEINIQSAEDINAMTFEDKWALMVTALPFAKAQAYDELGDGFKRAWINLQEGKWDEAIEGFKESQNEHPENVHVMVDLGRAYFGKGEFKAAEKLLTKADHLAEDIGVKLLRSEVLWALERFDIAEIVLQSAHDLDPENKSVLAAIAQHGLLSKDYESGIEAIEVLCEELPQDYSVWRLAGRLFQDSGNDEKAVEAYERVNQLFWKVDPQTKALTFDPLSVNSAAEIHEKQGNYKRALELLEALRVSTKGLNHIAICLRIAEVYDKSQDLSRRDEALDEAARFIEDESEDSPTLNAMKEHLEKIRNGEKSFSHA